MYVVHIRMVVGMLQLMLQVLFITKTHNFALLTKPVTKDWFMDLLNLTVTKVSTLSCQCAILYVALLLQVLKAVSFT